MGAKLSFQDVQNDELAASKLANSPNASVSTGSGAPAYSTQTGSIYVDSLNGVFYLNSSAGSSGSTWTALSSANNAFPGHYRKVTLTGATLATGTTAPTAGDLVGIYGTGAWSTSGVLPASIGEIQGGGSQSAAWAAGGTLNGTNSTNFSSTYLFNGTTWSSPGTPLTGFIWAASSGGSQNAAWQAGGNGGVTNIAAATAGAISTTQFYNGASWSNSGILSISTYCSAGAGFQTSALTFGGIVGVISTNTATSISQMSNGTTWSNTGNLLASLFVPGGAGTQNAAILASGALTSSASESTITQLFNGSTWKVGGYGFLGNNPSTSGGQNSALAGGGTTNPFPGSPQSGTMVYNGAVWYQSGNCSVSGYAKAAAGTQGAGLTVGGGGGSIWVNTTELHSQTTYRKLYAKYVPSARGIGIVTNTGTPTILLQGYDTTITYPPNVYLILNEKIITNSPNEVDLSAGFTISSIQNGGTNIWNYNLSTATQMLQIIPGMILLASGATSSVNNGTFVITNVNNATPYFSVNNAAGVLQAGVAGTIKLITTFITKTIPSEQDIVIGQTDSNGFIMMARQNTVSSVLARLR